MTSNNKYNIGQTVYLITDTDQKPRIVIGFAVFIGTIKYIIGQSEDDSSHYDFEISATKNILI